MYTRWVESFLLPPRERRLFFAPAGLHWAMGVVPPANKHVPLSSLPRWAAPCCLCGGIPYKNKHIFFWPLPVFFPEHLRACFCSWGYITLGAVFKTSAREGQRSVVRALFGAPLCASFGRFPGALLAPALPGGGALSLFGSLRSRAGPLLACAPYALSPRALLCFCSEEARVYPRSSISTLCWAWWTPAQGSRVSGRNPFLFAFVRPHRAVGVVP